MTAQMQMMRDHDLGFRGEQIVIARDPEPIKVGSREGWRAHLRRMPLLVEAVGRIPGVVSVSGTHLDMDHSPGLCDLVLSPADTIRIRCLEVEQQLHRDTRSADHRGAGTDSRGR